jgi:hypothetical protein
VKIVINNRFGGYNVSPAARESMGFLHGTNVDLERNDPKLVECVETLGSEANGRGAELIVVEIPDSVEFQIENFGGWEWIAEKHRTWTGLNCQVRK